MSRKFLSTVLLATAALLFSGRPVAQVQTADRTPGNFDFYVLALSWAPEFCATHTRNRSASECDPNRHYGFVVHGLWPQNDNGTYPQACLHGPPVSHTLVDQMLPIIPSKGLIQHEWSEHGTCSGLAAQHYFPLIQKAFFLVQLPQEFRAPAQQETMSPTSIEQKFAAANHAPLDAFRISCSKGEMIAVEVCLTKDLQFRQCGSGVRDCRVPQVLVRPTP
jgi:ribonuclease T2